MSRDDEGGEKSHEPTPRKLQQAREKGEIARSADLNAAAGYAGFWLTLVVLGGGLVTSIGSALAGLIEQAGPLASGGDAENLRATLLPLLAEVVFPLLVMFLAPGFVVLAAIAAQRGFTFAPTKLNPKFSRISMIQNAKNKFGRGGLFEFAKSFVKLAIYSACLTLFITLRFPDMFGTMLTESRPALAHASGVVLDFLFLTVVVAGSIGSVDFLWQRAEHIRKNRMTDREIQDEFKEAEGDPHLKQERRRRGQEAATGQMLSDVAKADVVIVNPTHYAVALKWDRARDSAPVVVAKGVDEIAARIRDIAAEAGVPLHRDPPCARALYAGVAVGDVIGTEHFRAVAIAIRFADDMRRRARAWGGLGRGGNG